MPLTIYSLKILKWLNEERAKKKGEIGLQWSVKFNTTNHLNGNYNCTVISFAILWACFPWQGERVIGVQVFNKVQSANFEKVSIRLIYILSHMARFSSVSINGTIPPRVPDQRLINRSSHTDLSCPQRKGFAVQGLTTGGKCYRCNPHGRSCWLCSPPPPSRSGWRETGPDCLQWHEKDREKDREIN